MFNALTVKNDSEMCRGCRMVNMISDVIVSLEACMTCGRVVVVFDQQEVWLC